MARREARSALVKLRVTDAEKEAVEVAAGAAGLSVSDYARRLLLAVPVAAASHRPLSPLEAAAMQADATGMPTAPAPEFHCPLAPGRCSFAAPSAAARCPVHGRTVVAS